MYRFQWSISPKRANPTLPVTLADRVGKNSLPMTARLHNGFVYLTADLLLSLPLLATVFSSPHDFNKPPFQS